ncbi:hypothetical protein WR164_15460 [Philodulcilactobacillus myokoensis]|uniref:Uncharacterized protein n=1 Tax=Philodulcilactobacillus myokoensis TaxID=2929573 RepID=A0A9W6B260_9LACO|nr:hypothetical protein [Philodulcilactobacillus myokoensis]GLB47567.1 hypothetical protein WR164_15460 [Philodulcilactobacillus myokoensis]
MIGGSNVKAIFAGHVHSPTSFIRGNILNVTGDSTAYHIDCRNPHRHYYNDTISYNIINIDGDSIGSHIVYLLKNGELSEYVGQIKIHNTGFINASVFKSLAKNG